MTSIYIFYKHYILILQVQVPVHVSHCFSFFFFRQGVYRYKKGTTAVLKTTQKKLDFDVVRTTVRAEPMET